MDATLFWLALISICLNFVNVCGLEFSIPEEDNDHWNRIAKEELNRAQQNKPNIAVAKNVILFLGDGMGVSTVTAARILKGQLNNKPGEEDKLSFETFPHVGLSKTYNEDHQVPDSAGTATAYFCGVKTNMGLIGLDARSRRGECSTKNDTELTSILDWSKAAGKSVGIISTTRITHATPAALYAHSPERNWESDVDMVNVTGGCVDIAKQLVEDNFYIDVVLGGGRVNFLRQNDTDPDQSPSDDLTKDGRRDGRNLIENGKPAYFRVCTDLVHINPPDTVEGFDGSHRPRYAEWGRRLTNSSEWKRKQEEAMKLHRYVSTLSEFKSVDPAQIEKLLGLFSYSHMQYDIDRDESDDGEPSIEEMTEKAIQILQKNPNGFFLMVEGGRIDQAHHLSQAKKSLYDTLAFDRAVTKAMEMTSESDTLIITTADHSHVFTIAGYPKRGNPIFGLVMGNGAEVEEMAADNKPYATLQYSNGPGANFVIDTMVRPNLTGVNTEDKEFLQQAGIPRDSETHGGEDVAIYARGPMSHLFHGVHEQHYIAHVMAYASCVGSYSTKDSCAQAEVDQINGGVRMSSMLNTLVVFWIALILTGLVW